MRARALPFSVGLCMAVWAVAAASPGRATAHSSARSLTCSPWTRVSSPSIKQGVLLDVAGTSAGDVWAVGEVQGPVSPPFTFHFDGTRWKKLKNLVPGGHLTSVVALAPTDAWIVGWGSTVLTFHWNGATWTQFPAPYVGTSDFVYALDASSSTDVWLVGDYTDTQGTVRGLTEHWDGSVWSTFPAEPSLGGEVFYDVAVLGPDDAWAVGYQGGGVLFEPIAEHWDGTAWSIVPMVNPPSGAFNEMTGVAGVASNDVWAVGFGGSTKVPLIEHWDGALWSSVPSPKPKGSRVSFLEDVSATSSGDVWAVGESDQAVGSSYQPLSEHWDGTSWSLVPAPLGQGVGNFLALSAITPTEVWAVGSATAADGLPRPLTEHSEGCSNR